MVFYLKGEVGDSRFQDVRNPTSIRGPQFLGNELDKLSGDSALFERISQEPTLGVIMFEGPVRELDFVRFVIGSVS